MADAAALRGRRLLVIEDDFLVAQVMCEPLEDLGAAVVGPIGWVDEALAYIEAHGDTLDGVILDLNLHDAKSYPVADVLARRNIPFVFATGYGADAIDDAYHRYPRCEKPIHPHTLVAAIVAACDAAAAHGVR